MAHIQNEIPIPGRKKLQGWLLGIGALFGLMAYGAVQNGDGKAMLICGAIGACLIFIGAKLKTTKKLIGKAGVYR